MAEEGLVLGEPPTYLRRGFEAAARVLHALGPRRYLVADAAGSIAYAVQPARKRRLCAHLHSRAAGGLSAAEARRRARASYRAYARMVVDTVWVHAVTADELLARHGSVDRVDRLHDARDSGRGGILVLVHFGSWDIAASLALASGHPLTSVMAPVGPPQVTALLAWSRRAKEMELFTPEAAGRGLIRALRRGGLLALLVDIPEGGATTTVHFRRGPVRFSTGPVPLARITGAPILPASCWRDGAHYRVVIHEPIEVPRTGVGDREVMQRIADVLEVDVARFPEQWYPFNPVFEDER